jgi:hypothetical protein
MRTQMVLAIFCHGWLLWDEEEEEGEGYKFEDDRRLTGSTLLGCQDERKSLLEMETSGGATAATMIATV